MSETDPNSLNEAALGAFLTAEIDGLEGPLSIRKFDGGQSNPTYLVEAASRKLVLRAKPPGKLLKSAHQVDREFRVMKALADTGVPVPKMIYLSGEDSVIGRMFLLSHESLRISSL